MTTSEFLEKIIAQYYTYNNAFIYINGIWHWKI